MTVAEDALILAIESSLQAYPPVSGLSEDLGVKGVRGRVTDLSHPLANMVGMANLAPDDVAPTLKMVRNRFSGGRKAYGWVTGPLTRPHDLGERLVAHGLKKID